MQPAKISIADLFQQREQYLVPLFQRGYVWTLADQICPLWEDITDRIEALAEHRENAKSVGGADKLKPLRKHFLGAIIVGPADHGDTEKIPSREVIDGQQRITTFQIMLLAARDVFKALGDEGIDDELKTLTYNRGTYKQKSDHMKVLPTNVARDVMKAISAAGSVNQVLAEFPVTATGEEGHEWPGPVQAYIFFHAMLQGLLHGISHDQVMATPRSRQEQTFAQSVIRAINKSADIAIPLEAGKAPDAQQGRLFLEALQQCFQIMRLQLDAEDDPQIIFETLNARGAPLTPGDLIRNFIFLRASRSGNEVDSLYEDYWRLFDERPDNPSKPQGPKFWRVESRQGRLKTTRLDTFFYFLSGLNKRADLKVTHVFDEFKSWWDEEPSRDLEKELQRISRHAAVFEKIAAPGHATPLERFSRRMQLLDTTTHIPLVLYLLEHKQPADPDFVRSLTYLESYFVRRFVVGLTTQSYNRTFMKRILPNLAGAKSADSADLLAELKALSGDSQVWPDDERFRDSWKGDQLYKGANTRRVQAILEGIELQLSPDHHEYRTDPKKLSVEHILPQRWKPADYPLRDATGAAEADRARLLHSIGNLTLVTPRFNTSLSNAAFKTKRPALAKESALALNTYFQDGGDIWDDEKIVERAGALFSYALTAWPSP